MNTCLQGRKITIEQHRQHPPVEILPVEILHLIHKLRWIGLEEEAEQLLTKLRETMPAGRIVTTAHKERQMLRKAEKAVPCLPDNRDCDFSTNPSNDKIDIDENLFTSLVVGYSELIDDSRVRFRIIGDIANWAMSQSTTPHYR
jgi:hypothetical protein